MNYTNILLEEIGNIVKIIINRPQKLNALNNATLLELNDVLDYIEKTDAVLSVIISGAGEKAFVAGADIKELAGLDYQGGIKFSRFGQSVFNKIENLSKPVIAAVNGFALGGGCELALSCHIRLASDTAKFGQPEVNLGIIPGYGGTQRLARLIGKGAAMEYILTGDMITAQEALKIGLVNKVYSAGELLKEAEKMANKISEKGREAIAASIKAINATDKLSLSEGLKLEAEEFGKLCNTENFKEGTSAFLEKRKPNFKK